MSTGIQWGSDTVRQTTHRLLITFTSDYQLDSGDLQLKVIWAVCDQVPVYNTPVEVYAEAVFRNKAHHDKDAANILPWTVIDSLNELNHYPATSASQYWSSIKDKYEPALKIHSYRLITQLDRLIDCNLRLRIVDELNST